MKIYMPLDNKKLIDMFNEIYPLKEFNNMDEKTKIDILEGIREEYTIKGYDQLNVEIVIKELEINPYKYFAYCDELQDCFVDILNDLKTEYEDLEYKIEELQDLSDIVPSTNKYIDQLTERLNEIDSILSLAENCKQKNNWKGLADLLNIEF